MRRLPLILIALAAMVAVAGQRAGAQRRVTPVNNAATATQHINETKTEADSIDRSRIVEKTDAQGRVIMVDTVTGKEFVDSSMMLQGRVPKMLQPLFYKASVSVDVFQLAMRAFGQKWGLVEFGAELNLHNRYLPVVEVGLGQAKNTPDGNNYTYRSPVAPYFRLGMNYNFLYNSNPDYLVMVGIRYGFSPFRWQVVDVTQPPGYWDEPTAYDLPAQNATAGYLELQFGLRIKIVGNLSMGWAFKYHSLLHESKSAYGQPWYIPGYGSRNGAIGAAFSLTYTIPIRQRPRLDAADLMFDDSGSDGHRPPDRSDETIILDQYDDGGGENAVRPTDIPDSPDTPQPQGMM